MRPIVLAIFTTTALATPSFANPPDGVATLDILPGWRNANGTQTAGLRIQLADGWKTYWRAPGDAGIPPSFDWVGSENINAVSFQWPVPEVSWINGMRSLVYHDEVVIPIEFTLNDSTVPAHVRGDVQIGVCKDICVPMQISFDTVLPVDGGRDPQIIAAMIDRPQTEAEAGVGGVRCAITPIDGGLHVATNIEMPPMGRSEEVVIEAGNQEVWVSEPETHRVGNTLMAEADMIHVSGDPFLLDRSALRITVLSAENAVDIIGCDGS